MVQTVIVSGVRTPFAKMGGALMSLSAVDLGGLVVKEAVQRAGLVGSEIDNVIMGMVLQGGNGQIPSRQVTQKAGLPWEVTSETINKVCASGLRAVTMADDMIRAGSAQVVVAGGMESMSNSPFITKRSRWGIRMGNDELLDLMIHDGLTCPFHGVHMAVHGSTVAQEFEITREEQDNWALRSHQRAVAAIQEGKLKEEILPVVIQEKKGTKVVDTDESPRADTSLEKLAKLPGLFIEGGTITAGNAPGVNDGAGALVLMDLNKAQSLGVTPLAKIEGHVRVGAEARYIASVPGLAINKLLAQKGLTINDIDLFEVNEAFAAVALTSGKITGWDWERVNVNGGAVALGHPIGASGARIIMTLIYELKRRGGGLGIAAICSGAAQGDAVLIKV